MGVIMDKYIHLYLCFKIIRNWLLDSILSLQLNLHVELFKFNIYSI